MTTMDSYPVLKAGGRFEPELVYVWLYDKHSDCDIEKALTDITFDDLDNIRNGLIEIKANELLLDSYIGQLIGDSFAGGNGEFTVTKDTVFDPEFVSILIYEESTEEAYARMLCDLTREETHKMRLGRVSVVANNDMWSAYIESLSEEDTEFFFGSLIYNRS